MTNNHTPKLILVAEDDDDLRYTCMLQLKRLGYVSHYARDGAEAVEMSQQYDYALVLMDLMMPRLDGCHAAEAIRNLDKTRKRTTPPIVAITALHESEFCEKFAIEIDDYVFKPVLLEDLQNTLIKWIG
jgi:CheY-like chemotaxis protein